MLVIELAEADGRAGLRVGRHRPARTAARPERRLECTYPVRSPRSPLSGCGAGSRPTSKE
jgi:hypothetical protein